MSELDYVDYINKLLDSKITPLKESLTEVKAVLEKLTDKAIINNVDYLLKSKEKFKVEFDLNIKRIDEIEYRLNTLTKEFENSKNSTNSNITQIKDTLTKFQTDLNLIIWITKNPRMAVSIGIGLYLFAISDIFPKIVKALF